MPIIGIVNLLPVEDVDGHDDDPADECRRSPGERSPGDDVAKDRLLPEISPCVDVLGGDINGGDTEDNDDREELALVYDGKQPCEGDKDQQKVFPVSRPVTPGGSGRLW